MKKIWPWSSFTQWKIVSRRLPICTIKCFLAGKCRFHLQNLELDSFVLSDIINTLMDKD